MNSRIKIIECPRDAIQGLKKFIPTEQKMIYLNQLLRVGFDTIDFGSFVSPIAIPQLKDTHRVLEGLEIDNSSSKLLSIVANKRGAEEACSFEKIHYLGFPLSVSEEFQKRNVNKSIQESLLLVNEIQNLVLKNDKSLVIYLSMAFGNPYGESYHPDIVAEITSKLHSMDINTIALADTIGVSEPNSIKDLFSLLVPEYLDIDFGAHLHSVPDQCLEKIEAAYHSGCKRFDAAINGFGGCPMAEDKLTGNISTQQLVNFFEDERLSLDKVEFSQSIKSFEEMIKNN